MAFVAVSFIFLLYLRRHGTVSIPQPREFVSSSESAESIRSKVAFYVACLNLYSLRSSAQLPNSIREWRCPNPALDESGNDAGDAFWKALRPVLRDAGFVLWNFEGSQYQYTTAGGDPLVNGFGYLIPFRSHAAAVGGGIADLRMFRYLASVIFDDDHPLDESNRFYTSEPPFPSCTYSRRRGRCYSCYSHR